MNKENLLQILQSDKINDIFASLYGDKEVQVQKERYIKLVNNFEEQFRESNDVYIFSSPGRTEIIGNHTDHNNGMVMGGAIDLDCIAVATKRTDGIINIFSEGYGSIISIDTGNSKDLEYESYSGTKDLIRGIINAINNDYTKTLIGFNVYISSNVIPSAGVSSSAAFETLICGIIDKFYPGIFKNKIDYAMVSRYAENKAWNKASGMLDQLCCCVGGAISIDFSGRDKDEKTALFNEKGVLVKQVEIDFYKYGYTMLLVQTGRGHADLSEDYSSIPNEMKEVAQYFGKSFLAEVDEVDFYDKLPELKEKLSHRSILRAYHFFEENKRVELLSAYAKTENIQEVLDCINKSGNSSFKYLQNCFTNADVSEQGISLALALTDKFINKYNKGVCRVHGGGFAGVIVAYIPNELKKEYVEFMSKYMGQDSIYEVRIRPEGTICINDKIS